ncbi:MAG: GNAT family N-acetyltransferase [Chitinophagaceae bacterium]
MSENKEFRIVESTSGIDWTNVSELFELVGWGKRNPVDVANSFSKSSHVCFIMDTARVVATGRTVDDGMYYGLIVDVLVNPSYQQLGLGRQIVDHLREKMKNYNFVTLTAAPGKGPFYEKLGWKKQTSAFLWPRDEKQQEEHCKG